MKKREKRKLEKEKDEKGQNRNFIKSKMDNRKKRKR